MRDDDKCADEKQLNPFDRDKVDSENGSWAECGKKCSTSQLATAEGEV